MKPQEVVQNVAHNKIAPFIDISSFTAVGLALMELIPPLTAALSLVWVGMRLYISYLEIQEKRKKPPFEEPPVEEKEEEPVEEKKKKRKKKRRKKKEDCQWTTD